MDIKNKQIAVYGFGVSNTAFIDFICKNHKDTKVYCFDDNTKDKPFLKHENVEFLHYKDWDYKNLSYIVSSPGIALEFPEKHFIFNKAKELNLPLVCDIEMFFNLFDIKNSIAVTGTNGKSTTVSIINHTLQELATPSFLAGNIGKAIFENTNKVNDTLILELSSFQLSLIKDASFNVSVLLNVSQDHINYHGSFENYIEAKTNIFKSSKENSSFIVCIDDVYCQKVATKAEKKGLNVVCFSTIERPLNGFFANDEKLEEYKDGKLIKNYNLPSFYIKGKHNLQNIIASCLAISFYNKSFKIEDILNKIATFKGIEHRQEVFANYNNIDFVNDSKATNMEASIKALQTFENTILLLGGNYKGDKITEITKYLPKVCKINMFGNKTTNELYNLLIDSSLSLNIQRHESIEFAINQAFKDAKELQKQTGKKVTVLLSPGCSSYDAFKNFEERGRYFKKQIQELLKQEK